jgi:hypothetical protein
MATALRGRHLLKALAVIVLLAQAGMAGSALSAEATPWRFGIEVMPAYVSSTDQLDPRRHEHNLGDLTSRNRLKNRVEFIPLIDISYQLEQTATEIYLATPYRSPSLPLALGVIQPLEDGSTLELSVFTDLDAKVWNNPYTTVDDREVTELINLGGRVDWRGIASSRFAVSVTARKASPLDDHVSTLFPTLERDGERVLVETRYAHTVDDGLLITPSVSYERGDYAGAAESFNAYGVRAVVAYGLDDLFIDASLGFKRRVYGDVHPYFDETRKEFELEASALFTRAGIFGRENFYANFIVATLYRESKTGFFDARTLMTGVGAGVKF